jgi:CRISPR-associated protein Csx14
MSLPQSTIRVAVDLSNPGQFFACCGLLELAHRLWAGAEGWFESGTFFVSRSGAISELLTPLLENDPLPLSNLSNGLPVKPIIAPLRLLLREKPAASIVMDAWLRVGTNAGQPVVMGNPPWNFWSGQQTSSGIWKLLATAARKQLGKVQPDELENLFEFRVLLSGRFGFDPGGAWNARDVGFSPNAQGMEVATSPFVELLAAVGVQRFRPCMARDRQSFNYAAWRFPLEADVAAGFASGIPGGDIERYRGRVVSRGQYAALGRSTPLLGDSNE